LTSTAIQFDPDFALDAAAARHLRNAGEREQPLGHGVVDEPAELFGRQIGGRHRVVGECAAVDIYPRHERFDDALRQVVADFGHRIANVRHGTIDRRADQELGKYIDLTLDDEGRDVAHIADVRDRTFHFLRDLSFQLRGRGAGLGDVDVDHRKRHIGIKIDGQADERDDAQEKQHHEQDDGRDGMTNRPRRNISHDRSESFKTGLTCSPSCRNAPAVATTCSLPLMPSAMVTPFCTIPDTRTARRSILCCAFTIRT
jgi:hypothetical protein